MLASHSKQGERNLVFLSAVIAFILVIVYNNLLYKDKYQYGREKSRIGVLTMELKIAEVLDIPEIMALIAQAKAFLKQNGVVQWQDGYPDLACIERDVARNTGYLCVEQENIIGYLCIDFDGEPAYDKLDGKWLSIQPYVVVHRFALDNTVKGKGIGSKVFQMVGALSRNRGIHSFKVDTDNDNQIMKHLLQKNGFEYCGTICFDNSEKIAYEKLI